jgi:hypothetical protein
MAMAVAGREEKETGGTREKRRNKHVTATSSN